MRTMLRSLATLSQSVLVASAFVVAACSKADAARPAPERAVAANADTAVFAGGCFWGVEAVFRHVRGVSSVASGYAGGTVARPSYEQVSEGNTGHAESVQVVYDPAVVSYRTLLAVFFSVAHNPTEFNRQGPDVGTQYRSAVFTRNAAQEQAVRAYVGELAASRTYSEPIVTEIAPLSKFWTAEAYHQNYLESHRTQPYIVFFDLPKLDALKQTFPELYREHGIASK